MRFKVQGSRFKVRRPETPEEARARRKAAQRRKLPPSAAWWRGQIAKGEVESSADQTTDT